VDTFLNTRWSWPSRISRRRQQEVLDFGYGICLNLYFFAHYLSGAKIFATDLSQKGLAYVHEKYPYASTVQDYVLARR
jgi:hypothetical protein